MITERPPDWSKVERSVRLLLEGLGYRVAGDLGRTPGRVARLYRALLTPPRNHVRSFEVPHGQMVVLSGIPFVSLCCHHLMPFAGEAAVGYIPAEGRRVVGLSKLARLVEHKARRLQLQEQLTEQIVEELSRWVQGQEPKGGAMVVLRAHHYCMVARGIALGAVTTTSALRGVFERAEVRQEFMSLAGWLPK